MPILGLLAVTGLGAALWRHRSQKKRANQKKKASIRLDSSNKPVVIATPPTQGDILKDGDEARHYQKVSLTALGFSSVGTLFSPAFILLSVPFLFYNYFYLLKKTHNLVFKMNKPILGLFEFSAISFVLFSGHYLACSLFYSMFFTARKLVLDTEHNAQLDFNSIFGDLPSTVYLLANGVELEAPLKTLKPDDIVVVRAGEMIPIDGKVVAGAGSIDQHMLTGEAQQVERGIDEKVFASTLLLSGWLHICVEKQGSETVTGKIGKMLEKTAGFKSDTQSRGEDIVEKGAGITLLSTVAAIPIIGLSHAAALTYSGFGYQMRLAAPLTVLNYLRIASASGILIKDGRALELLHNIDTVIFDKTGTLTEEIPTVENIIACNGYESETVLQFAASAERHQQHPVAQAISAYAQQQATTLLTIDNSVYEMGHGIRVTLLDEDNVQQEIRLGSHRFMMQINVDIPDVIDEVQQRCVLNGHSMIYMSTDDNVLAGVIELRPSIRPEAWQMVQDLHQRNKQLYIISGDQETPTRHLAQQLGIDDYYAETLPEDKAGIIRELQNTGKKVCFIGDGINDTIALQRADVSISLQGAASIATDAADIVLIAPNLSSLPYLFDMSQELHKRMDVSVGLNMVSGILCVSSVFIFGMGIGGAILLNQTTLGVNIANSMLPLLKNSTVDEAVSKKINTHEAVDPPR